jgi:ABC-type glycerol-3-phosphate transport system substrate-binding protein
MRQVSVKGKLAKVLQYGIALALVLPAVGLLAFGPRAIDELPKDRVIVDYWETWTGHEAEAMRQIVGDFNGTVGEKEGIFVRYLSTANVEQKTLIATAAGVPPDVAGLADTDLALFASRQAILPLDDLAAAEGIGSNTYKKVFWDVCHYDGHLYAIVSTGYDYALYVNKEKMRAAGIDPDRAPATLAELDADARKMDEIGPGGAIKVAGFLPTEPGWVLNQMPYWFGGDWWDAAQQRFTFNDPRVVATFRWVQGYPKRLGVAAVRAFGSALGNFDSPQNAFFSQVVATEIQGTFFSSFIDERAPQLEGKYGVVPFPSEGGKLKDVTVCSSNLLTIPRGAKHPKEAFEFIAFVTRQEEMEKLSNLHGKISPLSRVSESFYAHHTNPYIRLFDRLAASPNARECAEVPIMPEVTDEMRNFTDKLNALNTTPEEGLDQVQETLQAKYDAFAAEQQLREREGKTQ